MSESEIYIQSAPNNSKETYTFNVWAEPAVLGSAKTALKFKYEIGYYTYTIQCMGQNISFKSEINNP